MESTGTQYIDTIFEPSKFTTINLRFNLFECVDGTSIFGAGISGLGETLFELRCASDSQLRAGLTYGDKLFFPVSLGDNSLVFNDSQHKVCLNNNLVGTFTNYNNFQERGQKILLFSSFNPSLSYIKIKLYSCQILDNGTFVRNFVPVVRLSDMKPGLYDLVNDQFYVNQGAGEFLYGGLLPAEYQQVEYIESTGTQYIDSGIIPNQNTNTIISLKITPTGGNSGILGARISSTSQNYGLVLGYQNGVYLTSGFGDNNEMHSYVISADVRYLINKNCNKVYINNSLIYEQNMQTFNPGYTMYLFAVNQVDVAQFMSVAKLYSCKIYDNGTLVRNFIPCYRKADSKPGLYDLVNNVFYTNSGTGEFLVGPDI